MTFFLQTDRPKDRLRKVDREPPSPELKKGKYLGQECDNAVSTKDKNKLNTMFASLASGTVAAARENAMKVKPEVENTEKETDERFESSIRLFSSIKKLSTISK